MSQGKHPLSWPVVTAMAMLALPSLSVAQALRELPVTYAYPEPAWSPYIAGGLIGLLVVTALVIARKPVGASSAYASLAGLIGKLVAPRHIASLRYFHDNRPMIGWSILFLMGTIAGAWLAAWSGDEHTGTYLQGIWVRRFGPDSAGLRTALAFAGGTIMAFGARLAGGCTSGHGISGTLQLSVGSWVSVACFFVGGIAVAMPLYRW